MANKENWEVSYIDEDGVYHGDVQGGLLLGANSIYTASGAIAITDNAVCLDTLTAGGTMAMTLADGVIGQSIIIYLGNATNSATVSFLGLNAGLNLVTLPAIGDSATLVFLYNIVGAGKWVVTNLEGTASVS